MVMKDLLKRSRAALAAFGLLACGALLACALAGCSASESADEASGGDVAQSEGFATATTEELEEALASSSAVVLDARNEDAYAGWSIGENEFGGHIDGARLFSANWLSCDYDDNDNYSGVTRAEYLAIQMEDAGIAEGTKVIVYDEGGEDAEAVASYLAEEGVEDIALFDLADYEGELASYERYELYVPATAVNALIEGEEVEEIGAVSDLVILEVSWGDEDESGYSAGHVPGAVHVNSDDIDDEDNLYVLASDEELLALAASQGITLDSTVIVTGEAIYACHYAVVLKYLGVEDVYVMSGGASAWTDAGFELEEGVVEPTPVESIGTDEPANPDLIDTVAEVQAALAGEAGSEDYVLVDTRTTEEYLGETSGYSYIEQAGRIEGSVSQPSGINNSSSMLCYQNVDGSMRDAEHILALWEAAGLDPDTMHLSFHCGNGYRAAEIVWDALVLGYDNVSHYNDGWAGWVIAELPYVVGE